MKTATVLMALVLAAAGSACGTTSISGAGAQATNTCSISTIDAVGSAPVVGVLTSISASDSTPAASGVRHDAFSKVLDSAAQSGAVVVGDVIAGGRQDARLVFGTRLVGGGPNRLFKQQALRCKLDHIASAFKATTGEHVEGPADVHPLSTLSDHLVGLPKGDVSVMLLSSMVNTAPALDLTDPATLNDSDAAVIARLHGAGLVPDCRGWQVYVVASSGPAVVDTSRVRQFWTKFFEACGGSVVVYDTALTQFPVTPRTGTALNVVSFRESDSALIANVPAAVLFTIGSAELLPSAADVLDDLYTAKLAEAPEAHVTVTGFTDSTGSTTYDNHTLSLARAEAVTAWLIARGLPVSRVRAIGRGATEPVGDNSTAAGREANRRVEISIEQ